MTDTTSASQVAVRGYDAHRMFAQIRRYSKTFLGTILLGFGLVYLLRRPTTLSVSLPNIDRLIGERSLHDPIPLLSLSPGDPYPIEEIQEARKALVREQCAKRGSQIRSNPNLSSFMYHALVNDDHKVIYCHVPKVATSSWKYLFLRMANHNIPINSRNNKTAYKEVHKKSSMKEAGLKSLEDYHKVQINKKLDNYFKFMIVRHPLDRLASAYYDKFQYPQDVTMRKRYAKDIITRFRPDPPNNPHIDDVRFEEFIKYVLSQKPGNIRANEHWQTYQLLCEPCAVDYDYIGTMDTLAHDVPYILDKINATSYSDVFPNFHSFKISDSFYQGFFRNLTISDFHKLIKVYSRDMLMFNYTWEDFLLKAVSTDDTDPSNTR